MEPVDLSPEQQKRLQACLEEAAAILYADSDPTILTDLEAIETQVRRQMLTHVGPQLAVFLSTKVREQASASPEPSVAVSDNSLSPKPKPTDSNCAQEPD